MPDGSRVYSLPNLLENFPPRLARIAVALEGRQGLVQNPALGWGRFITTDKIGLVQLRQAGKELRAVARAQSREFCKNLDFAHRRNLPSRREFGKLLRASAVS